MIVLSVCVYPNIRDL